MCENVTRAWDRSKLRTITVAAIAGAVMLGTTSGAMAGNWKKGRGHYYYAPRPSTWLQPPTTMHRRRGSSMRPRRRSSSIRRPPPTLRRTLPIRPTARAET